MCAGNIKMASIKDTANVNITISDTWLKKLPIRPSKKKKVEKAIIVVNIPDAMGAITSKVPSIAALTGVLPFS